TLSRSQWLTFAHGSERRGRDATLEAVQMIAKVEEQVLGAQLLARLGRRTVIAAATALGTCVEVQNVLPGEVLNAAVAEPRSVRLFQFCSYFDLLHQGLVALCQRPQTTARGEIGEEYIRDGCDDVEVFRVGKNIQED